jgi:catechol 2,3-dioxygenase-like lactoylglutathione lyase family enzyme
VSFDYQQALYHVGVRVPDLEAAMTQLGAGLGVTWAEVVERDQPAWTPTDGAFTVPLRFTYSCEGPQHVELLQGAPGSLWDGADLPGVHHQGIWVDDVAAETERLIAAGWKLEMAQKAPEDGYGSMTYVRSPSGFLLEPVSAAVRPRFERWWAGGPFA